MKGNAALIWILLNDIADDNGEVAISLREIAKRTGLDHLTVIRSVRKLIESECIVRLGQDAHHAPMRYRVVERPELLRRQAA
jgi:DNA-binding Lrp family transcriptional regulator